MLLKCAQIIIELHIILIVRLKLASNTVFNWKTYILCVILKSIPCVAFVRKVADEVSHDFFQTFRSKNVFRNK
jgi:hypothetical protein